VVEIHAYHGWGFDGHFWDDLKLKIPEGVLFKAADRGYFGGDFNPEFSDSSSVKIIFTHSFGLHWCDPVKIDQSDYVVAFNAFDDFLPQDFFERRKESKVIRRMADSFKKDPKKVLKAFYKNCFFPEEREMQIPSWRNESRLLADLLQLRKTRLKSTFENTQLIVLGALEDQIVPADRTHRFIEEREVSSYRFFKDSGHGLPVVNSSDCWSFLCEVLPIFEEYANTGKSQ